MSATGSAANGRACRRVEQERALPGMGFLLSLHERSLIGIAERVNRRTLRRLFSPIDLRELTQLAVWTAGGGGKVDHPYKRRGARRSAQCVPQPSRVPSSSESPSPPLPPLLSSPHGLRA